MFDPIPDPVSGKSILPWAVPVTRALNSLGDKVGAHARNERDRRGGSSPDMGCWKIVVGSRTENEGEEDEATVPVRLFANQFYLDGNLVRQLQLEDAVEDFVCQGELEDGEDYTTADKPFVALKIPTTAVSATNPELVGYATAEDLQTAQRDVAFVVVPLYKFTHDGLVAVDFRNCPAIQNTEMLP
jgi:hypothetical protein